MRIGRRPGTGRSRCRTCRIGWSPADGPEQHTLRVELSEEMGRLLEKLPEKQREILVLRVVVGLSAEETAEAVGSTPGAVRVAQHRALARLRKSMPEEEVV